MEFVLIQKGGYVQENWVDGKYVTDDSAEYRRVDHAGEMDHYDPLLKEDQYWLWNNLFMIDATVNSRKDNKPVLNYLKPDLDDYLLTRKIF